jgi:sterol desaturase/sphingolipid hydroxylase (fatty acid hydroxylase superfamily)
MDDETGIRLGFFFGVFGIVALGEILAPRRAFATSKTGRWFANLAMVALNPVSVRLVFPVLPLGMAIMAQERHWGLLNNVALPYWLAVVVGVMALDLAIYLQHILFHAIPILCRLHMVHHADSILMSPRGCASIPSRLSFPWGSK